MEETTYVRAGGKPLFKRVGAQEYLLPEADWAEAASFRDEMSETEGGRWHAAEAGDLGFRVWLDSATELERFCQELGFEVHDDGQFVEIPLGDEDNSYCVFGDVRECYGLDVYFGKTGAQFESIDSNRKVGSSPSARDLAAIIYNLKYKATRALRNYKRKNFGDALHEFVSAGYKLLEVWHEDSVRDYPDWAPSFDELVAAFHHVWNSIP